MRIVSSSDSVPVFRVFFTFTDPDPANINLSDPDLRYKRGSLQGSNY